MDRIVQFCGCLPCLLMGYPDVHTSIEHATNRGRRLEDPHRWTVGLCTWHHFGHQQNHRTRHWMRQEFGPSLIWGRVPFEEHFGDELDVLVPTQDFMLSLFESQPWPEYSVPRDVARRTRERWIELNQTAK